MSGALAKSVLACETEIKSNRCESMDKVKGCCSEWKRASRLNVIMRVVCSVVDKLLPGMLNTLLGDVETKPK